MCVDLFEVLGFIISGISSTPQIGFQKRPSTGHMLAELILVLYQVACLSSHPFAFLSELN